MKCHQIKENLLCGYIGFSLIEVLCALSIMSLLAYSVRSFSREYINNSQLNSLKQRISLELTNTQRLASELGRPCSLNFSDNSVKTSDCAKSTLSIPDKFRLSAKFGSLDSKTEEFLAYPTHSNSAGSIIIFSKRRICRLSISIRGAIREHC